MPAINEDLHGNVPDESRVALLLIDVINDMAFEGGENLLEQALPMARNLVRLKRRARETGIPAIYVNDNFGRWWSDLSRLLDHCLHDDVPGEPVVELLKPDAQDYFVLKPKHSGFYATTLETLLAYLKTRTLILTGIAGNSCILFTANDAYMRDYQIFVPEDCVASQDAADNRHALRQMAQVLKADTRPSLAIDLEALKRQAGER